MVLSPLGSRTMQRSHILTPRQCPGVTFICCRNLIYNLFTHAIKKITKIYPFSLTIVYCYILRNKINVAGRHCSVTVGVRFLTHFRTNFLCSICDLCCKLWIIWNRNGIWVFRLWVSGDNVFGSILCNGQKVAHFLRSQRLTI